MESFLAWLKQLQFDGIWQTALLVAASLLAITVHETSHGYAAYRLGDPTAKRQGRLTLNPLRHVDLWGLAMMALFRFGWAKPVPVDPRYFKKPKAGMALTALAGPASNVLLAYAATVLTDCTLFFYLRFQREWLYPVYVFLTYLALINAGLAVFNLIPIPPLDGSKVLFAVLPDSAYAWLMRYERWGMLLLMLLLTLGVIDTPLSFLRDGLMELLGTLSLWVLRLLDAIF